MPESDTVVAANSYASCWWLQDHIEFSFGDDVHACCFVYVDKEGKTVGNVHLVDIKEDRFPDQDIIAKRKQIHQEISAGTHGVCLGCPELKQKIWEPPKYLAKFVTMNVWSHCNLKCYYCFVASPTFSAVHVKYDVVKVIGDMLNRQQLDPNGTVTWGGGDISALVEFNELSLMYLNYGVYQSFKTSAFKFLPGVAQSIAKKRGAVEISIDAGTRETFDRVKGKDAFDRVVHNVARYREHGAVDLKYIAGVDHIDDEDIAGFVGLVRQLTPQVVTVTPEWAAHWNGRYTPDHIGQVAKLIHMLMQTETRVIPDNRTDRERLFPKFWAEVESQLELLGGRPPIITERQPATSTS